MKQQDRREGAQLELEPTRRPSERPQACRVCERPWSWLVVAGTAADMCDSCDELAA